MAKTINNNEKTDSKAKREEKLVTKILADKEQGAKIFWEKYQKPLFSFILKRCQDKEDAKDILQETLISAFNSLPNFSFKSSLFSWLCGIANHEIADFYRKKKIKTILFSKMPFLEEIAKEALSPEERYLRYELQKEIKKTFKKLNEGYFKILRLKYIEERPVKFIAQKLKKSVKAIESKLTRARIKFKKIWEKSH